MAPRANPWLGLGMNAWALGMEAASVMTLRTMKIAAGGAAAETETRRMIAEKIEAGMLLQAKAMTAALGVTPATMAARTLTHYRRSVRANRRRLSGL